MKKGVPNKIYTPEVIKLVIETMHKTKLGYNETQSGRLGPSKRAPRNGAPLRAEGVCAKASGGGAAIAAPPPPRGSIGENMCQNTD